MLSRIKKESGKVILTHQESLIVMRHHNLFNYGVDGTFNGLVYAGKGDTCQRMYPKNRECITVQPFVSFAGMDLL